MARTLVPGCSTDSQVERSKSSNWTASALGRDAVAAEFHPRGIGAFWAITAVPLRKAANPSLYLMRSVRALIAERLVTTNGTRRKAEGFTFCIASSIFELIWRVRAVKPWMVAVINEPCG